MFAILILMLIATPVYAVEVNGIGVGVNEQFALTNAKRNALEQVTGAFVVSKSTASGGSVNTTTSSYSGGSIRSYEIVDTYPTGNMTTVVIRADVDTDKHNELIVSDGELSDDTKQTIAAVRERTANVAKFAGSLDTRADAFVVAGGKQTYLVKGQTTDVTMAIAVKLSPKWIDDVRVFASKSGTKIDTDIPTSDVLWGLGAALAPAHAMGASLVRTAAHMSEKAPQQTTETSCFSRDNTRDVDSCYAIGYMFGNVVKLDRFVVSVRMWSNNKIVIERNVVVLNNSRLFALYDVGSRLYFSQQARERKFLSRGVVWFTDGTAIGQQTHTVDTATLETVDAIDYVLR